MDRIWAVVSESWNLFLIFFSCLFTESRRFAGIKRVFRFLKIVSVSFFSCPIVSGGDVFIGVKMGIRGLPQNSIAK